ncbi:hypothetical protein JCM8208_006290 [Rhodotorula glutinis]
MRPSQHSNRHEGEASRTDRGSWPLPPHEPLPWPTPGNEDAINRNPRLYGATRPTRTAGDGYYARAAPPVPHEDDPLAHLFPSPVSTVQLPDSHFAFADRSHDVDKLYEHRADNRRKTPNWSFHNARAPVSYEDDVPHDLELPEDGSRMQFERSRSRSRSAHLRQDSGNDGRARSSSRGRRSSATEEGERDRRGERSSSSSVFPRRRSRSTSTAFEEDEARRSREGRRPSVEDEGNVHGVEDDPLLDVHPAFRDEERARRREQAHLHARARSPSSSPSPTTAHRRAPQRLNGEDDLESLHERPASVARSRRLESFDGIMSPRLVPNDVHERRPVHSRIPTREWLIVGGAFLGLALCSIGGWGAWYLATGQQNKA